MNEEMNNVENVLGINLINGKEDYIEMRKAWAEFCRNPTKYAGSIIVDLVKKWYFECIIYEGLIYKADIIRHKSFKTKSGNHIVIKIFKDKDGRIWYTEVENNKIIDVSILE